MGEIPADLVAEAERALCELWGVKGLEPEDDRLKHAGKRRAEWSLTPDGWWFAYDGHDGETIGKGTRGGRPAALCALASVELDRWLTDEARGRWRVGEWREMLDGGSPHWIREYTDGSLAAQARTTGVGLVFAPGEREPLYHTITYVHLVSWPLRRLRCDLGLWAAQTRTEVSR